MLPTLLGTVGWIGTESTSFEVGLSAADWMSTVTPLAVLDASEDKHWTTTRLVPWNKKGRQRLAFVGKSGRSKWGHCAGVTAYWLSPRIRTRNTREGAVRKLEWH